MSWRKSEAHFSPADRVCHYAGARAFADQRAEEKQRVAGAAGIETAGITRDARKEKAHFEEPAFLEVRRFDDGGPPILAAAVLRFECVERWKEGRKAALPKLETWAGEGGVAYVRNARRQAFRFGGP